MSRAGSVAGMQRELVERAIGGDQDAFSSLVDASVDRLYAVATLILRDSDRAQDAVQDALVSAWRDVRALRDPDAWDAWLHRLTVWACYRVGEEGATAEPRRAARRSRPGAGAPLRRRSRPSRTATWSSGCSNDLTIDHRAVIVLRFYLDLPVEEVAHILDIPVGTAKSRIHRGLGGAPRRDGRPGPAPAAGYAREGTA